MKQIFQNKSTKKSRQMLQDSSDEEVKDKVTVTFQSDRSAENKKDDLATSTVQIDTEIDKDARTIFEKSLQGELPTIGYSQNSLLMSVILLCSSARAERQS